MANLGGKMEIHPFKDIPQVEGLDDKGNQETGAGDRGKDGSLL